MKKTFYKILITMLTIIVACSLFAACGEGGGGKKYDHLVTFDYNVGNLGEGFDNQYLGVKDGSLVAIKPGYSDVYKESTLQGYYIEGWYTAKTDGEGKPLVGSDGRVQFDKKWDFERDTVSSAITLYANFVQEARLVITGGDEDVVSMGKPGAVKKQPNSVLAPKKAGYTFIGYYTDDTYQTEFSWPYTYQAGVTTTVYARFMEGIWELVSTADEFISALATKSNIYVTADLDFTGKTWPVGVSYGGEIAGNGHKLTGINAKLEASKNAQTNFGLFGLLEDTANLHDFTIENAQVSFTDGAFPLVGDNGKVALFAWKMEAGAKLTNLTVSGTVTKGSVLAESDIVFFAVSALGTEGVIMTNCDFTNITLPTDNE